jgi:hypothetical protein
MIPRPSLTQVFSRKDYQETVGSGLIIGSNKQSGVFRSLKEGSFISAALSLDCCTLSLIILAILPAQSYL